MKVLITGGTGFIGSHTAVCLIEAGHDVVIVDNFSNSKPEVLNRIKTITGVLPKFYNVDMLDGVALKNVFKAENIEAVIHFAALKAVGESVQKPVLYYKNNLISTLNLLDCVQMFHVKHLVFSSSATVYGDPESVPIDETFPTGATTNPYGTTKVFNERMITDFIAVNKGTNATLLRYFNPIGAHKSGRMGEDPNGVPNNLAPYILKVAAGKLEKVSIFGDDYKTPDGTGVRDYLHVMDLARGHKLALDELQARGRELNAEREGRGDGLAIYNLGTGKGYSVLEMVKAFSKAVGKEIPYVIAPRRAGDIAECFADTKKAEAGLGFKTEFDLDDMCRDSWNWQTKNPNGYGE